MGLSAPAPEYREDLALLAPPEVVTVLYEAEQPVLFTVRAASGKVLLAYLADQDDSGSWLILAPADRTLLLALKAGMVDIYSALTRKQMWLVRQGAGGAWEGLWRTSRQALPARHLPLPGVLMYATTARKRRGAPQGIDR